MLGYPGKGGPLGDGGGGDVKHPAASRSKPTRRKENARRERRSFACLPIASCLVPSLPLALRPTCGGKGRLPPRHHRRCVSPEGTEATDWRLEARCLAAQQGAHH